MDQERYWMWTKQKTSLNSHVMSSNTPSYGDSWEEQAFAEDAAGPLGGCIWPPRSYTCSFCGREFRSAQALGGHMNVHRRDRARLNQSPSPNNKILDPTTTLSTLQYPTQVCNMICNPNSDSHHALLASTSLTPSRVSLLSSLSSPRIQGRQKGAPIISWSKSDREKYFNIADSTKEEKGSKVLESNSTAKGNHITADLSVNLNLVIRQRYATPNYDRDVALSCKRRRTDETLSFFPKMISVDGDQPQSEVLDELSPTSTIENLDLELRLGDRP